MAYLLKHGVRVLGVAESFVKNCERSIISGVVMRGDFQIDGFSFSTATIGGMDATQSVINLYENLNRSDVNFIMLNGCIISWFNIIDLNLLYKTIKKPLICVTYEESEGIEKYLKEYFPDWRERLEAYRSLGEREAVELHTGHRVLVRCLGVTVRKARLILNRFTLQGAVPEPLRVARLLSRALLRCGLIPETLPPKSKGQQAPPQGSC
ncbi:MAG: endonuclease dU [Candidatus Freyarchaeota archaeon]